MEDLANKDAEKKSKAAEAALLSELDLNDKKNSDKGGGNTRQVQEKSKDKKKKKDHRMSEELKVVIVLFRFYGNCSCLKLAKYKLI